MGKTPDMINEEKQEDTPSMDREANGIHYDSTEIINGVTVYKAYRKNGPSLWDCLLEAMGKV